MAVVHESFLVMSCLEYVVKCSGSMVSRRGV